MACFHPLPGHRDREGGPVRIGRGPGIDQGDSLELPCGCCIGCKLDRARDWSLRIMHESMSWPASIFVTLTYAPEHLDSPSLRYPDFQRFMKRLRKAHAGIGSNLSGSRPVRFFCSAEYGDRLARPHFHACLFNYRFDDQVRVSDDSYRSADANALWAKGEVHIGTLTPSSAAYVAGYTLSKVHGHRSGEYYNVVDPVTGEVIERRPPFCTMSRRPGIGSEWFERFSGDLRGDVAVTHDGKRQRVPRFYLERMEGVLDPVDIERLKWDRELRARSVPPEESSEARRLVREEAAYLKQSFFRERNSTL